MNPSSAPGKVPSQLEAWSLQLVLPGLGEDHQIHQLVGFDQRVQGRQPQELERERDLVRSRNILI